MLTKPPLQNQAGSLCLALLAGAVFVASPARLRAAAPEDLAATLQRFGIRAVLPAQGATDFTLLDLSGSQKALSEFKGRWVLLTFFATWCGACHQAMGALEGLHQTRGNAGLEVIAVAIDGEPGHVADYARGKGLTFTVLVDAGGQVGRIYRAQSVPVSYLIDPSGRIVGVARGARNWAAATALIDDLLALQPVDSDAAGAYAPQNQVVSLPSTLVPPDASVSLTHAEPEVGEAFAMLVDVTWAGDLKDYVLLPPKLPLPEGVEFLGTSATTSSRAGRAVITYRLELRAKQAVPYALDPVELRYMPRGEHQEVARRLAGPTVSVGPRTLAGMTLPALGGSVATLVALAGLAVLLHRRQRRHQSRALAADAVQAQHAAYQQIFAEARRARVRGDIAGSLEALGRLNRALGDQDDNPGEDFLALLDRVRYGGYCPPQEELDNMQRRAERRVQEMAPNKEDDAVSKIKLASAK